jgi:hypothetical protein
MSLNPVLLDDVETMLTKMAFQPSPNIMPPPQPGMAPGMPPGGPPMMSPPPGDAPGMMSGSGMQPGMPPMPPGMPPGMDPGAAMPPPAQGQATAADAAPPPPSAPPQTGGPDSGGGPLTPDVVRSIVQEAMAGGGNQGQAKPKGSGGAKGQSDAMLHHIYTQQKQILKLLANDHAKRGLTMPEDLFDDESPAIPGSPQGANDPAAQGMPPTNQATTSPTANKSASLQDTADALLLEFAAR